MIHSDFETGYIRAQTFGFEGFIAFKGEQGAKDYVLKDGNVRHFLFSS